ncbi:MAG TPA: alpha/beta hydrolase [Pirellulaceae bacterium]|nr:alpha/beta hydrolase [Pirellulaceae bacterium]
MGTANDPSTGNESGQRRRRPQRYRRFVTICLRTYLVVLLVLLLLENKLIFPAPRFPSGDWKPGWLEYEDVAFVSADGTKLHGWYLDHPAPNAYLLYCHGNGEHVAYVAPVAEQLRSRLDVAVFAFDYRGYGRSEGTANEAGVLADSLAAHHWLAEHAGVAPDQIVLMGRSIGGAVAVDLADQHGSRALILENTFTSLPDVAARLHWWVPVRWLMRTQLNSVEKISRFRGSLLQSHGTTDELVPISYGKQLFDVAPTADKQFLIFEGLGHNDYPPDDYYERLREFVLRLSTTS